MSLLQKLTKATPLELYAWGFGLGFAGFGLGALSAGYVEGFSMVILIIGLILHGWGMYRIYLKR